MLTSSTRWQWVGPRRAWEAGVRVHAWLSGGDSESERTAHGLGGPERGLQGAGTAHTSFSAPIRAQIRTLDCAQTFFEAMLGFIFPGYFMFNDFVAFVLTFFVRTHGVRFDTSRTKMIKAFH